MIMCDDKKERYYWFKKFIQGLRAARDELERRKNQRASILDQIGDVKEFLRKELRTALEASGKTQAEVNRHLGTQMARLLIMTAFGSGVGQGIFRCTFQNIARLPISWKYGEKIKHAPFQVITMQRKPQKSSLFISGSSNCKVFLTSSNILTINH